MKRVKQDPRAQHERPRRTKKARKKAFHVECRWILFRDPQFKHNLDQWHRWSSYSTARDRDHALRILNRKEQLRTGNGKATYVIEYRAEN